MPSPEADAASLSARCINWERPHFIANPWLRWGLGLAFVLYLALALGSIDINWVRIAEGLPRAARLFAGFLTPDFTTRWDDISIGLTESLTMTVTSTVAGVLLSIPLALAAARNLMPLWIYLPARGLIAACRAFHEIIVAILFVAMFGFGTLAGFLTLTVSTIGFLAKLLADDIEEIDPAPVEAMRAAGARFWQIVDFSVASQVMPRLVGLSLYRVDINFRDSAIVGIVGAGGVGATLNTALDRYEFDSAAAVLIIIIAIVLVCEYASAFIRARVK